MPSIINGCSVVLLLFIRLVFELFDLFNAQTHGINADTRLTNEGMKTKLRLAVYELYFKCAILRGFTTGRVYLMT